MAIATIWNFIKFFKEEEHADRFLRGGLYLNRLAYFKEIESDCNDGRPDTTEAVAMWWQPYDLRIDLNVPGIGGVTITKDDLAGPVSTSFDYHDHLHVLCLYAMHTIGYDFVGGRIELLENEADKLKQQLAVDDRCLLFGPHAVVVAAVPFLAQLKKVLQQRGQWFRGKLVDYYDEDTFDGEIAPKEIPFKKQKRFSYQHEFRVCVQTRTTGKDPITIDMGDISQFATKVGSSQLNSLWQLKLEPIHPAASVGTDAPAN